MKREHSSAFFELRGVPDHKNNCIFCVASYQIVDLKKKLSHGDNFPGPNGKKIDLVTFAPVYSTFAKKCIFRGPGSMDFHENPLISPAVLPKSMDFKGKSRPGQSPGKGNPLKIPENPPEAFGISGKSWKSSRILENSRGIPARASPEAPKSPESPECAGDPKKRFKNDFFETYKQ